jgi:hypothetical protein
VTTKVKRSKNDYVDKKEMYEAFVRWKLKIKDAKEAELEEPRVPEYIGKCIQLIAINLAKAPNFSGYSYKDEMISDGIENCLTYIKNFDPEKSTNPFGYFTQIIYYAFLRRIQKEKKQVYTKHKLLINDMTFNNLVTSGSSEHFDGVKLTYDPEKMAALEELFETKKPSALKKKATKLEKALEDDSSNS